jgi:uncharacterized surface protein with fasciclin (FAS1) repeats
MTKRSALTVMAAVAVAAFSASADHHKSDKSIVDVAKAAGSFNTLLAAAEAAGLAETLAGEGPFTVFAPTDEAFAKLPDGAVEALLGDPDKLKSILLYHVVPGKVTAADVTKLESADTAFGQAVMIGTSEGVTIDGASVVKADVMASNGVIHVIDSVLMPKDLVGVAAANENFSTLVAAVQAAGLVEALKGGPFTVFAPTDDAFAKLPEGTVETLLKPENKSKLQEILKYHVVAGIVKAEDVVGLESAETLTGDALSIAVKNDKVHINDATVTATDIPALNGVIHVVDTVILPKS